MQPVDASDQPATVSDFPVDAHNQTAIASVHQVSNSVQPFAASFQAVQPDAASVQAVQPVDVSGQAVQPVGTSVQAVQPVANNVQAGDASIQPFEANCMYKEKEYKVSYIEKP